MLTQKKRQEIKEYEKAGLSNLSIEEFLQEVLQEIKEYEEAGLNVVVIGNNGTIEYSTQGMEGCEYCDQCKAFRLLPDPDPHDWFRDDDMKAVCLEINGVIKGALESSSEWTNIRKPLYCPKLGRELSEEEKKEAAEKLEWAKKLMNM